MKWLWFALAAVGGAWGRVRLSEVLICRLAAVKWLPGAAAATLLINLTGCLIAGAMLAATTRFRLLDTEVARLVVFGGLLGAFTTFSAYAAQMFEMLNTTAKLQLALLIVLSNFGGLLMIVVGYELASLLFRRMFG